MTSKGRPASAEAAGAGALHTQLVTMIARTDPNGQGAVLLPGLDAWRP